MQTHNFRIGKIKHWDLRGLLSFTGLQKIIHYKRRKNSALVMLPKQLNAWNKQRISRLVTDGQISNLSIEDVSVIKNMIHEAQSKSSANCTQVFMDQLFFLTIGAIQIQSQTNSSQAWKLLSHSVDSYLNPKSEYNSYLLGTVITVFVIYMSVMQTLNAKHNDSEATADQLFAETTISAMGSGTADPVTISMLQLAYSKMKNGVCQLPQAVMLPERQRQAFLTFVNEGKIDVNNVENLRDAFGYVSCLYPQELMRPLIQ